MSMESPSRSRCLDPSSRVGIDVEPIVPRSPGFEATAFLPGERGLLDRVAAEDRAEWMARFWCAKEAMAKATGHGFVDGPSSVEVVEVGVDGSLGTTVTRHPGRNVPGSVRERPSRSDGSSRGFCLGLDSGRKE